MNKMAYSKTIIVLASILLGFVFTETAALECYFCSTYDADGTACNDPIDPSAVSTTQCAGSKSVGKAFSALTQGKLHDDNDFVCASIKFNKNGQAIVERGCVPKEIDHEETCQYIKEYAPVDIKDLECKLCDSSLCNH